MAMKKQTVTWVCDQCGKTVTHENDPTEEHSFVTGREQPFGAVPHRWYHLKHTHPMFSSDLTFCALECLLGWAKHLTEQHEKSRQKHDTADKPVVLSGGI